ncbi:Uncharacterized protein Adt_04696 [Abeliophyllum distichum]|uniref:Polyprotein n=1 Tax=Abeliophyllum distichum TaxID=126358 RepID=A0ABD1V1Z5_9LAMI
MLVGDFIAMHQANIVRYDVTFGIDDDNMLFGGQNHQSFSWRDNQNNIIPQGPQFQQPEKRISLEDMFDKFVEKTKQYIESNNQFMRKTETTLQNQGVSIKNLETQMGQMAVAISEIALGSLPINTVVNPKERVKTITNKSGVQLTEIHVKRPVSNKENVPPTVRMT